MLTALTLIAASAALTALVQGLAAYGESRGQLRRLVALPCTPAARPAPQMFNDFVMTASHHSSFALDAGRYDVQVRCNEDLRCELPETADVRTVTDFATAVCLRSGWATPEHTLFSGVGTLTLEAVQ